jgi:hypothetical protein
MNTKLFHSSHDFLIATTLRSNKNWLAANSNYLYPIRKHAFFFNESEQNKTKAFDWLIELELFRILAVKVKDALFLPKATLFALYDVIQASNISYDEYK